MPLKRRQTAKTSHSKIFIKDPSKIPSVSTNTNISLPESNQQNSNVIDNLPDEEKQISAIIDMRFVFGEQYAKVSFKDQSLKPQWEPVKDIKGAEGLILKFQQKKEEEEREKRMKELKDSKDKEAISMRQKSISCPLTFVNPPSNYYDSKLKSVKFAQELVKTKTFSNNDMQFYNTNESKVKATIATIKPILKSALRMPDKQPETKINNQNNLLQWNGILLKGKTREFVAKVNVKALKEGPNYKVISDKLSPNDAVCMANTVPLSYALFLIDEEPDDILIMECESGNLKEEQNHMKSHKSVAFIRLENDYNGLHFFVFADYRWICKNLHFDQEPLLLVARSVKIKQKYLLVQQPFVQVLGNETTCNANYYKAKMELFTSGYNDIVIKLCEQKPNFTVYARPKFGEADSIITVMKFLGANYFPSYDCDSMDLVLVHVLMLDQINFMPNLIKLRHQEQCKFYVYGWDFKRQDPIEFEEYFASGGILSITTRVLLEEEKGLQKILDIVEYQKRRDANWKVLMDPEIKYNNYNLDALNLSVNNSFDKIDFFDILLWRKLKKPNDSNISRLYYALLYSYSFKVEINKSPRHCILIAHHEEMSFCPKVPGVNVVTLKDFEENFGFDDTMEWE